MLVEFTRYVQTLAGAYEPGQRLTVDDPVNEGVMSWLRTGAAKVVREQPVERAVTVASHQAPKRKRGRPRTKAVSGQHDRLSGERAESDAG